MEDMWASLYPVQVITTDGEIASVYVTYEDYDATGEKLEVTGDMVTDFVRTPAGWKMIAKTFSVINLPK
jgi:hypothetical protein